MIHSINPAISTKSINKDTSSARFSLIVLITCGINELAVHIPAANPMSWVHSMYLGCKFSAILLNDHDQAPGLV